MSEEAGMSELELAALVSSRICHDVISPVGAIANGLEVLADETDEAMREHAFALIRSSATQASAKLQFARLAFGAAGSAGAEIDLRDAEKVARGILDGKKHTMQWDGPLANLPKDKVKLLLNMVTIGVSALPRGGAIAVSITGGATDAAFVVRCQGDHSRLPEELPALLAGGNGHRIDAHSIQPYYAGRIARAAGMSLAVESGADGVVLRALPIA